ncbi:MAG: DNA polymerase I [Clostridia bacterium]|nr:DNA polymerase I [Clostridia bacterium]
MKKLLVLDANSIINRAFYAVRLLTTKEGVHTNAIFGFLNILFKYVEEIGPDYLAAAFDLPAPTFRHKMFDGYKATRHKMPDELAEQMPLLKEVLTAMNIPIFQLEGYEADDIIGTFARTCTEEDVQCCVLTGDRDDLQLASENVHIHLVTTRMGNTTTEVFDDKKVFEKYGVTPEEFIDLKAIMGDSSDNIPGVKGIGEKGATALIQAFHSVDGIYENIDSEQITKSVRTKLTEGKDDAYMSKTLATIDTHVPIEINIPETERKEPDSGALFDIFTKLEFRSFIKKMGLAPAKETVEEQKDFFAETVMETVLDEKALTNLLDADNICYILQDEKIAFTADRKKVYCAKLAAYFDVFKSWLESGKTKITHGLKPQLLKLSEEGISAKHIVFDTEIATYLLEPSRKSYDLAGVVWDVLGVSLENTEEESGQLSLESLLEPTVENDEPLMKQAAALYALKNAVEAKMQEQGMLSLFREIEMPLVEVLASMEEAGITVDRQKLSEFGNMLKSEISRLTAEIYKLAGKEFNINSPKQLGAVLFEDLALPTKKKTKSGYSTGAEVLEKLREVHPIIDHILEYRKLTKLNSTYVEGLIAVIHPETGKVHSSFNQTVTVTGRISSTEPNLQNIPVRTELGREMRKMFTASENHVLIDADYSQIELRVLAHLAGDENMRESFISGKDIHASTAAKVFGVSEQNVTPEMRSAAKAINFGLVYGMGEFSLSQDLGITVKEAKRYIEEYLGSYPKVKQFMHDTVETAKQQGYVTTLFGRKRDIPELSSSNFQMRAFGERAAMNTPVQGTAADIIKLAMVAVHKRLKEENLSSCLILQVHDELIIEATKEEEEKVCLILKEEMEQAASLTVPLLVDMHTGHSWFDTK